MKEKLRELFEEAMKRGSCYISTHLDDATGADQDNLEIGGENGWQDFEEFYNFISEFDWTTEETVKSWKVKEV